MLEEQLQKCVFTLGVFEEGSMRRGEQSLECSFTLNPILFNPKSIYFLINHCAFTDVFLSFFFLFRLWHQGEPNFSAEECASIVFWSPGGWGWNDVFCDSKRNSICEMKKVYL